MYPHYARNHPSPSTTAEAARIRRVCRDRSTCSRSHHTAGAAVTAAASCNSKAHQPPAVAVATLTAGRKRQRPPAVVGATVRAAAAQVAVAAITRRVFDVEFADKMNCIFSIFVFSKFVKLSDKIANYQLCMARPACTVILSNQLEKSSVAHLNMQRRA